MTLEEAQRARYMASPVVVTSQYHTRRDDPGIIVQVNDRTKSDGSHEVRFLPDSEPDGNHGHWMSLDCVELVSDSKPKGPSMKRGKRRMTI